MIHYYVVTEEGRVRLRFSSLHDALRMAEDLRSNGVSDITTGGEYVNENHPGSTRNGQDDKAT